MKLIILILLIFIDYFSKKIIFNFIELNNFIIIFPFLDFIHIHNYGIAFGLFTGLLSSTIIVIIGSMVTLFIIYLFVNSSNKFEKWGFVLIISGALANLIDRAINKYVLDFIYMHYESYYWPAYNFADIYITLGVVIVIVTSVKVKLLEFKKE